MAKVSNKDIFDDDLFIKQIADSKKLLDELYAMEAIFKKILNETAELSKQAPLKGYADASKLADTLKKGEDAVVGITEAQKKQADVKKRLVILEDEDVKAKLRSNSANKEQRDELKDLLILENKQAGTLEKLTASNRKLARERNKLNLDTAKGRRELVAINKQIDLNNEKIKQNSDTVKKQKLNVGNYTESIKGAVRETGLFSGEIAILERIQTTLKAAIKTNTEATTAQAGAQKVANAASLKGVKALKALKVALVSSGIGVLLVGIGSLVAYLTKTQQGMDSVERATNAVSTTFSVLLDRLAATGKGFSLLFSGKFAEGFAEIKGAFAGISEEISNEVGLIDDLTRALQDLRKENAKLIVDEARIRAEVSKLWFVGEDEKVGIAERITALRKAFDLEKNLADERIRLGREQLLVDITGGERTKTRADAERLINEIIAGRADLSIDDLGVANSTIEDLENANKQIADVIGAQNEQYEKQRSLMIKINTLTNEQNRDLSPAIDAKTEEAKIEQLDIYLKREKELTDKYLSLYENATGSSAEALTEIEKGYSEEVLQLQIDRITEQLNNEDFAINEKLKREKELNDLIIEQEKNRLDEENRLADEQAAKDLKRTEQQAEQQRQVLETSYAVTEAFIKQSNERRIGSIDQQISDSEKNIANLEKSAELRSENENENIAFERKRQAELQADRAREIKRQKALELGLAVTRTYSSKVASGEKNALASTVADTAVLTAFIESLPTAFVGTNEKTVGEVMGAPHLPSANRDQYIVRVDKDETILSPEKTKEYHNSINSVQENSAGASVSSNVNVEINRLADAIKSIPATTASFDAESEAITYSIKRGNNIARKHIKKSLNNGIF